VVRRSVRHEADVVIHLLWLREVSDLLKIEAASLLQKIKEGYGAMNFVFDAKWGERLEVMRESWVAQGGTNEELEPHFHPTGKNTKAELG
jgi:hypothetical protein